MAKISRRGKNITELWRVSKESETPSLFPGEPSRKNRTDYVATSDGRILAKTTWFKADGKVDHSGTFSQMNTRKTPDEVKAILAERGYR